MGNGQRQEKVATDRSSSCNDILKLRTTLYCNIIVPRLHNNKPSIVPRLPKNEKESIDQNQQKTRRDLLCLEKKHIL